MADPLVKDLVRWLADRRLADSQLRRPKVKFHCIISQVCVCVHACVLLCVRVC